MFSPIPRPPPVTSALPDNGTADLLQAFRVLERGQVAGILPEHARAHGAAHDLRRPRLRQRADPEDPLRLERLAERLRRPRSRRARRPASRPASARRRSTPPRPSPHAGTPTAAASATMPLEIAADSSSAGPMRLPGDVERVVGAAVQVPVAVLVDRRPVAVHPHAGKARPVRLEVALVVAPDPARHARPRPAADELADLRPAHLQADASRRRPCPGRARESRARPA